jgi:hypothetical protein
LQNLCRVSGARKDSVVRQALARLPKGLHDTYARIVQQITEKPEYDRSLGIRCLRWVLYAQRPLHAKELQYALATFKEGENVNESDLDDLDTIFGACANLVVLERTRLESAPPSAASRERLVVRPAHYSVQEYFAGNEQSPQELVFRFSLGDTTDAHTNLSVDCLAHLRQPMMSSGEFEPIDQPGCRLSQDLFLNYAAKSFDIQLQAADPEVAHHHVGQLLAGDPKLFCNIVCTRAMELHQWFVDYGLDATRVSWEVLADTIKTWSVSSFVAATGLLCLPEIEREYRCQEGLNIALLFACSWGTPEHVGRLLDYGADIECRNADGHTPLHVVAVCGYSLNDTSEEKALLLMERGANIMTEDNKGDRMPMAWAFKAGPELVQQLLQRGADVDDDNPLATSTMHGRMDNVRCLVAAGADPNATRGTYGPPLHAASARADCEMIAYLIDNGADVNLQYYGRGSALCRGLGMPVLRTALLTLLNGNEQDSSYDAFLLLLRQGAQIDPEAISSASENIRVRELATILLELDDGPRYSAIEIKAALVAAQKKCNYRGRVPRFQERKRDVTLLLQMRLLPSDDGMKLATGPDIRTLTTSICEIECNWVGDGEWESDASSERESDVDSEEEEEHTSRHPNALKQKKGRPVPGRHRARRVYVWFVLRRKYSKITILLHEHG